MASEIDRLFEELARVLDGLVRTASKPATVMPERTNPPGFIKATASVYVRFLDEAGATTSPSQVSQPLVDVMETRGGYRVVVALPGVRQGDVKVSARPGWLRVEVVRGEKSFSREIPCSIPPEQIAVASSTENNSVVEMLFSRKGGPSS